MTRPARGEAGFTLIEVMIALGLFALVAVAGAALVDAVLRVQSHTAVRMARLGDIQRAMFVVANDLGQAGGGPVTGDAARIAFARRGGGGLQAIGYALAGGVLVRTVGGVGVQTLLDGVTAARWRFYQPGDGWVARWPPAPARAGERPAAVSVDIALAPAPDRPGGTLRRLVPLPAQP